MKAGWHPIRLGDIADVQSGGTPLISNKAFWSGEIPWYSSGELNEQYTVAPKRHISQLGLDGSNAKLFPSGSLLIGMYDTAALKMSILDRAGAFNQAIAGVKPNDKIDLVFVRYAIDLNRGRILGQRRGVRQKNLSLAKIRDIELRLPPLPEQQRIVAILDEAFEAIAAARANAEQNRQNARALFESYLQSVFSQRGEGWVKTTVAAATGGVFTGPFGSLLHKSDYIENGIPLVNPAHITNVGIEPDLRKTVSVATAQRLSSYIMRTGDIVIGRRGEMGRCAIVTDVEDGWLCGTGSFVIKPSVRCDARYLVRLLRSKSCKSRLEEIAGGAVMPNLSNTDLGNFPILLPPIDMQKAILEEIDALHKDTHRLESLYQRKIEALDELKQSLLQQAFSGNL